ncbi:hypothetical protein BDZ97DRAFT_1913185 [Flammula alnicola]|nr:hypothetical protein BDZ97DRAFT_1913185 [Flammula alnicola]
MFSLSEKMTSKMLRFSMWDKHTKIHLVRTYPKGNAGFIHELRAASVLGTWSPVGGFELADVWCVCFVLGSFCLSSDMNGLVLIDLGYMINHAMFQRNGRSGYVLKPDAIRLAQKEVLTKRTFHSLNMKVISAQQLASGQA